MAIMQKTTEVDDNSNWRLGVFLLIALAALLLLGSINKSRSQSSSEREERTRVAAATVARNLDSAWRQKAADSPITTLELNCR